MSVQPAAGPLILKGRALTFRLGLTVTSPILGSVPLPLSTGPGLPGLTQIDDIAQGVTLRFHGAGRYRRICTRAGQTIAYPIRGCGVLRRVLPDVRGMAK